MNVVFFGVITAQAALVLLGIALLMLSAALLALVAAETVEAHRAPADVLLLNRVPARTCRRRTPLRSLIDRQSAAPSRAPPTFPLRHSWVISRDDSLE